MRVSRKTDPYVAGSPATQNPRLVILSYICLRSWRPSFHLSSFFATMEKEIPPWNDGKRKLTVTRSNETDQWKNQNLRRDGRNKRVYTYVNMQRRKSCIL